MKWITNPIRECIKHKIWMPALATSLTLPDICGWLERPYEGVGARYIRWASEWFQPMYTRPLGPDRVMHVFLSASDLYALRCAINHNGSDQIADQKAQETLESFEFLYQDGGPFVHLNKMKKKLQLQVDVFCNDMCEAVDRWDAAVAGNRAIQEQKLKLMSLRPTHRGF